MPQNRAHSGFGKGENPNSRLALCNMDAMNDYSEQERYLSLLGDAICPGAGKLVGYARSPSNKKSNKEDAVERTPQNRMTEAAMLIRLQD
ncbi:hypothetical protein ACHAXA_004972 [Cyclostephanos tholiformis]|uniref:Uncharacterized protein n=1 Tax=Cyclostephanos tholiformis TaxID=382380 RepID=A0ABD3R632_9STRA